MDKTYSTSLKIVKEKDSNIYCVYIAKRGEDILYIGSGVHGRWEHVTSGVSHSYELNRLHFSGIKLEVSVVLSGLSKKQSLAEEKLLILLHKPPINVVGVSKINVGSIVTTFKLRFKKLVMDRKLGLTRVRVRQYCLFIDEVLKYYTVHDILYGIPLSNCTLDGKPRQTALGRGLGNKLGIVHTMKLYKNIIQCGSKVLETFTDNGLTYLKVNDSIFNKLMVDSKEIPFVKLSEPKHFVVK